jgi:hypothetical protein
MFIIDFKLNLNFIFCMIVQLINAYLQGKEVGLNRIFLSTMPLRNKDDDHLMFL